MHEAGLLAAAVADALAAAGPGSGRPTSIEIRVHDPIHVAPESARLHAELALRARGWTDIPIEVVADPVDCLACGVSNEVQAGHPFCAGCGWPLPDQGGHAVEAACRWDATGALAGAAEAAGATEAAQVAGPATRAVPA